MGDEDAYVLCDMRTLERVQDFLSAFAPRREQCADEYPFPYLSHEPSETYARPEPLIERLVLEVDQPCSLYWQSTEGRGRSIAMLFFTSDGGMIAGLGGWTESPEAILARLQQVVCGQYGYTSVGPPPPDTTAEFISLCERADPPSLYAGEMRTLPDASRDRP